ncbi:MAG: hypothetical protein IT469_01810 [Pseudomonadales bacterium]|nr:hypothetical protein [Pseudomonadales bacterium]
MSAGPRIPLARALAAAQMAMRLWGMAAPACAIVGSVRRRRTEVGDIEIIAPLPEVMSRPVDPFAEPEPVTEDNDHLFARIAATTRQEPDLFNPSPPPPLARVVRGLEPGFLACSLELKLAHAPAVAIPVQIYRYTPANRGWCELMRTGPTDFGMDFLVRWKARFGIAGEGKGSIDGHLVDSHQVRVPTPTEDDCFRLCGMAFIPPEERDEHAASAGRRRAAENREVFR